MKGQQFSVGIFTAAVLIFGPVLGSIQDVEQEEYGMVDAEDNSIFQGVHTQPDPLNFEMDKEIASVFVTFSDVAVDGNEDQYITSIIKSIGKNCTQIVLSGEQFVLENLQVFTKQPILVTFLQAVIEENGIRQVEGLDALQIFLHIPGHTVHAVDSLNKIALVGVGFGAYIFGSGIISGIILESSLIQNPVVYIDAEDYSAVLTKTEVWTGVVYMNTMMKALKIIFGHDFKLGLSVNSFVECGTIFLNVRSWVLHQFDFILYNGFPLQRSQTYSSYVENMYSDLHSDSCRDLFQEKDYYRVKQVFQDT